MKHPEQPQFLPISPRELRALGIDQPDIIIVSGDAYVDHPSFAAALLGRVLWDAGFTVAIIPQPDPKNPETFRVLGEPRLFFAISGGSVDSMVSNYTAARRKRSDDAYSPGGIPKRPDRAVLVYTDLVHRLFPDAPIIIGGLRPHSDGSPIMTTGLILSGSPFWPMLLQIFLSLAWGRPPCAQLHSIQMQE